MKFDLTNTKFGKLTALSYEGTSKSGHALWKCICDCGNEKVTRSSALRKGEVVSCGCIHRENARKLGLSKRVHGHNSSGKSTTYYTWCGMKERCSNPNSVSYKYYGAKGVTYHDDWEDFNNFLRDMGERPEGLTLDRINPYGNYEKNNCRWSTQEEQVSNKRVNYVGKGLTNLV